LKSLRWRIVILLISLVCGVLFLTSSIIDYTLNRSFQHYLSEFHRQRREEMINTLTRIHQVAESWEEFFKLPSAPLILRSAGVVRLTDEDGRTLFLREELNPEAQSFLPQQNLRRLRRPRRPLVSVPLYIDDQLVGTAWIYGPPNQANFPPREKMFHRAIGRAILFASLFAGILAVIVGLFGAEYLTRPLAELTATAQRLAGGDLKARTNFRGAGELGQLAETMNHLAAELERADALRRKSLADTAHELRTPITTIQSHLEAFADGVLEPTPENLATLTDETLRLVQLVEELQSIALVEQFRENLNLIPLDLNLVVRQAEERMTPLFIRKGITLRIILPEEPVRVMAHGQAISQILDNLLVNAAKYTPEHDGRKVTLTLTRQGEKALLQVEDEGVGIPGELLPHIFDRFYRVDPSRSRNTGGIGLGLAIAKETAEAIGGTISVESELGKGTKFTLVLPLAK
jgi:two-component system sensor histidine kinase BaeS